MTVPREGSQDGGWHVGKSRIDTVVAAAAAIKMVRTPSASLSRGGKGKKARAKKGQAHEMTKPDHLMLHAAGSDVQGSTKEWTREDWVGEILAFSIVGPPVICETNLKHVIFPTLHLRIWLMLPTLIITRSLLNPLTLQLIPANTKASSTSRIYY